MRKSTKLEIVFGLFALALIYLVFANDASITGFVVSNPSEITLVSPVDNTQTQDTSVYFIFKYPPEFEMKECSLMVDYEIVRTATGLLDPYDTRIRADLMPGSHLWGIKCIDKDNMEMLSPSRRIVIEEEEAEPFLNIVKFPNKAGNSYEFELIEGLELEINGLVPNDAITVKINDNRYDVNILRLIQDYSTGTEFVELLVIPSNKRIKLYQDSSVNLDFNNDGENDMKLILNSINYRKAYFTASTKQGVIEEEETPGIEKPSIIISPLEEEGAEEAAVSEKAKRGGLLEIFLIGVVIILVIAIISIIKNKEFEEKKYVTTLKNIVLKKKKIVKGKKQKSKNKAVKKKALKKKK